MSEGRMMLIQGNKVDQGNRYLTRTTRNNVCILVLASSALAGCGDGHPETWKVHGRVVFTDGDPVRFGTVELESLEHSLNARGRIGDDGRFDLSTYETNDGAVAPEES